MNIIRCKQNPHETERNNKFEFSQGRLFMEYNIIAVDRRTRSAQKLWRRNVFGLEKEKQ